MEKRGRFKIIAPIWIMIGILFLLVLLALLSPLKEVVAPVMSSSALNCSNPTDGTRGSCIALRGTVLFFVLGVGYYVVSGVIERLRAE